MTDTTRMLLALPPELLAKIFDVGVEMTDDRPCLNLASTCKHLYGVGMPFNWRILRSFSPIMILSHYLTDRDNMEPAIMRLRVCFQNVRRFDAELSTSRRLCEAIEAHSAILACCKMQVIFPKLQGLSLKFNETEHLSAQEVQDLLTPLLSPGLTAIELTSVDRVGTVPMQDVFPRISSQVEKLQELSLPQLPGEVLSGHWLAGLRTLTLWELRSAEDISIVGRMSGLQDLRISSQCSQIPNLSLTTDAQRTRMRDGALPALMAVDLTAHRVDALESLLLMLPPSITLQSCKLFLRNADESWSTICTLLASCIAFDPTTLRTLRLGIDLESDDPVHLDDWRSAGLRRGQLDFLRRYRSLRTLDLSADAVEDFWIYVDDNDIKNLAMSCPELCKLILEGNAEQTEAQITLLSLMYLATFLKSSCEPLHLQLPLSADGSPPSLSACPRNLAARTATLHLPNNMLPIQSNTPGVIQYLVDVMPRIRRIRFMVTDFQSESEEDERRVVCWKSVKEGIDHAYAATSQRHPRQEHEDDSDIE